MNEYDRIAALDDDEFEDMMEDPKERQRIIDALIDHFAGTYKGGDDVDAVIHIKLWDKPGGGYEHYELVLADGACTVSAEPEHEPRLTLKVRPTDLRKIVNGDAGPRRLALQGRLRAIGDIRFGMKLTDLFEV